MSLPFIGAILEAGLKIIDKVIPDPKAKAEAQLKLMELQQSGELAEMNANLAISLGQIEVNKAEASSGDTFKGGWRPSAGYVCVAGLAYQFLIQPLGAWVSVAQGWAGAPPDIDMGALMVLLGGMLGLGGLRTTEKVKRVS